MKASLVIGINPVTELLASGQEVEKILVCNLKNRKKFYKILSLAKEKNIAVKQANKKKLDSLSDGANHQGVIAFLSEVMYSSIEHIINVAKRKNEDPFVLIADHIEDPHNLGAIIRTAECAGVHGVIIAKRNCCGITPVVSKTSAGAVNFVPIARENNLSVTIDKLKDLGFWIYCADMVGKKYSEIDFSGPVALIIGNEGHGVSHLLKEKSDISVSLPMKGRINSLNASVAAGILMFEISKQHSM